MVDIIVVVKLCFYIPCPDKYIYFLIRDKGGKTIVRFGLNTLVQTVAAVINRDKTL